MKKSKQKTEIFSATIRWKRREAAFDLARLISKEFGVLEPMQSKYTIMEQEEELRAQIEKHCSGKVILVGHSWGEWRCRPNLKFSMGGVGVF